MYLNTNTFNNFDSKSENSFIESFDILDLNISCFQNITMQMWWWDRHIIHMGWNAIRKQIRNIHKETTVTEKDSSKSGNLWARNQKKPPHGNKIHGNRKYKASRTITLATFPCPEDNQRASYVWNPGFIYEPFWLESDKNSPIFVKLGVKSVLLEVVPCLYIITPFIKIPTLQPCELLRWKYY